MKIKSKMELLSGDSITAAYQAWGSGPGRKEYALGGQRAPGGISKTAAFLISFSKERSV
jgi:hypothetical protein